MVLKQYEKKELRDAQTVEKDQARKVPGKSIPARWWTTMIKRHPVGTYIAHK